jgi:hypothetical protein
MNTTRSDALIARFEKQEFTALRKVQEYDRLFEAEPEKLFPLLCPAREADWIPGWTCDLIYTTTGYVQPDCIFKTGSDNPFGAGTWVIYDHEPDKRLQLVMTSADMVLQMRIAVSPAPGGGTHGRWTLTMTGLTPEGNSAIEALPDQDPHFIALLDCLDHYLKTGEMSRT